MPSGATFTQPSIVLSSVKGSLWRPTRQIVWTLSPWAERLKDTLPESSVSMASSAWIAEWSGCCESSWATLKCTNWIARRCKWVTRPRNRCRCITEGDCKNLMITITISPLWFAPGRAAQSKLRFFDPPSYDNMRLHLNHFWHQSQKVCNNLYRERCQIWSLQVHMSNRMTILSTRNAKYTIIELVIIVRIVVTHKILQFEVNPAGFLATACWIYVYCPRRLGTPSWGPQSNHGASHSVTVKTLILSCWAQIDITRAESILGPSSFQLWKIKFPRLWQRVVCPIPPSGGVV